MTLDEMVVEMAAKMLADRDDEIVQVWVKGLDWGWARPGRGEATAPLGAMVVAIDRVQNVDADATDDRDAIGAYAGELKAALLSMITWPATSFCDECQNQQVLEAGDGIVVCASCGHGIAPTDRWWEILAPRLIVDGG